MICDQSNCVAMRVPRVTEAKTAPATVPSPRNLDVSNEEDRVPPKQRYATVNFVTVGGRGRLGGGRMPSQALDITRFPYF